MVCGGRIRFLALLARQPHLDAVAGRVLLHAGEVQHLREHAHALADRLALATGGVQGGDERGDVGGRDLVYTSRAEERKHATELDAMSDGGFVDDVDPRGAPALGCLGEGRHGAGRIPEATETGDANGRELAGDPAPPRDRLSPSREGAGIAVGALAAAQSVPDEIAAAAATGLAPLDPDARHGALVLGRRGRCVAP